MINLHNMSNILMLIIIAGKLITNTYTVVLIKDVVWCEAPYCKNPKEHTICKFGIDCKPAAACQTSFDFGKELKEYLMEKHNEKRNIVALGEERRIPSKYHKSSNMNILQWDLHLEYVARCHSRQCDSLSDKCRITLRFPKVGQNIFTTSDIDGELDVKGVIDMAIEKWYGEIEDMSDNVYEKWEAEAGTEHFTQMIWAKTSHIGCGLSQNQKDKKYYLVCNYGAEGNRQGQPIYNVGEPCSRCIKHIPCNVEYKGLCGEIIEYPVKCPCE